MRLPWVSRTFYEETVFDAQREAQGWRACYEGEARRFDQLMEKYHALKLVGASVPEPIVPRPVKEFDPLTQAVNETAKGKPPHLRAAMLKQLTLDKKAIELGTLDENEVIERILQGVPQADGVAE